MYARAQGSAREVCARASERCLSESAQRGFGRATPEMLKEQQQLIRPPRAAGGGGGGGGEPGCR